MNGLALLVCSLVCGADVRESLPTAAALYEVIDHSLQLSSSKTGQYRALDGGVTVEHHGRRYVPRELRTEDSEETPWELLETGKLHVVPVPGHPNLILAGYVYHKPEPVAHDTVFASVWIDVDRNAVIWPESKPVEPYFLPQPEVAEINAQLIPLVELRVQQLVARKGPYPILDSFVADFHRQFVDPPETKVGCKLLSVDVVSGKGKFQISLSGGGRTYESSYDDDLRNLLMSDLAIPAEEYFTAKPTVEKETK